MNMIFALALLTLAVDHGNDGHDHHHHGEMAARSTAAADVRTSDANARTALLRHEALPELGMPAMVMEFSIAEGVDMTLFEPGAALTITATMGESGLTVIEAEPEAAE
ncbi:copper-binding protein [Hyphobacterium sp. HN65]|uniref:Copper-binding protein n=1 Tax=Hyphobacterium lacteum TaxID=3116575 RepID=A0ABU7LTS4_9PROT|nr:copper-binding protein [Hyphobacterium sp. HN65]MEE2527328.1 copper-binding protein [Hyphobacterium sp. HN65]